VVFLLAERETRIIDAHHKNPQQQVALFCRGVHGGAFAAARQIDDVICADSERLTVTPKAFPRELIYLEL